MIEEIKYKGYTIEIHQDAHAQNPWTEWDGEIPLIVDCGGKTTDYSKGDMFDYIISAPTDNQIIRHQKELANIFDIDLEYLSDLSKSEKVEEILDAISDYGISDFDKLEGFCKIFKIPCLNKGHLFFAPSKQWFELTGCKKLTKDMMEGSADLWDAFSSGNVYGFDIDDIHSCWGYYGNDHEASGLLAEARSCIDYHIKNKIKTHTQKVKNWIKSKVPIIHRTELHLT